METELKGKFKITMALPAWTVENELTLDPRENGELAGALDTLDGGAPIPLTRGRWNKNYFQILLTVGPGRLELTGKVEGDALAGTVVIEDTPDELRGSRVKESNAKR